MYRALLFVVFTVVVTTAEDPMEKCGRLFRPESFHCCSASDLKTVKPDFEAELRECYDMPMKPFSCTREECIAKKKGYLASDGGVDKEAFGSLVEKELILDADKLALIKENCIKGDISKFGPPDMCDLMKMWHCLHVQMLKNCPEWNDKGECSGMKELYEECEKMA